MKHRRDLSIYFYAGDFLDVIDRHRSSKNFVYGTHSEVAKLFDDLESANIRTHIVSFLNDRRYEVQLSKNLTIECLGLPSFDKIDQAVKAVSLSNSAANIIHFPNKILLKKALDAPGRMAAYLASSFNSHRLIDRLRRRTLVNLLNRPKVEVVSNHCWPSSSHLVDLGVKASKIFPWDVPHKFKPNDRNVRLRPRDGTRLEAIYVGGIVPEKGVGELIGALSHTRDLPLSLKLVGAGDYDWARSVAKQAGVEDRVELTGLVSNDEAFEIMVAGDAICVPSRHTYPEGFPLVMFEAMASGTPIVCSDHPIFLKAFQHGESAMIFEAGSEISLAMQLRSLFTCEQLYGRLSSSSSATWARMSKAADWRTSVMQWVNQGASSPYLLDHFMERPV